METTPFGGVIRILETWKDSFEKWNSCSYCTWTNKEQQLRNKALRAWYTYTHRMRNIIAFPVEIIT